jgi:hypothetical protein
VLCAPESDRFEEGDLDDVCAVRHLPEVPRQNEEQGSIEVSTLVMSQCWPLQMPPTQKAVLISLADNANDHGVCWPSIPTIAMRTCFSERAIQGAIKWLETNGALKADRSNGRHTSYTVTPATYQQPPQEMHPRSKCTGAADAGTPAGDASVPPQEMHQPPQEVPSNRKEPSSEPSMNRQTPPAGDGGVFNALKFLKGKGVAEQHAKDWLRVRKDKKLPPTQTALEDIAAEVEKSGVPFDDVIKLCCVRGWAGFKASWLTNPANGQQGDGAGAWWSSATLIEAEAKKMGIEHNPEEPIRLLRDRVQAAKEALGQGQSAPPRSRTDSTTDGAHSGPPAGLLNNLAKQTRQGRVA